MNSSRLTERLLATPIVTFLRDQSDPLTALQIDEQVGVSDVYGKLNILLEDGLIEVVEGSDGVVRYALPLLERIARASQAKPIPHAHTAESYRAKIIEFLAARERPVCCFDIEKMLVQRELLPAILTELNTLSDRIVLAYQARTQLEEDGIVGWAGSFDYFLHSPLYRLAAIGGSDESVD